jgi:hypothetical protein
MKKSASLFLSAVLLTLAATTRADTLTLKDGTVLTGQYLGGDASTVRFQTSFGLQIIEMAQVKSMSVAPAATPAPAAAPAPAVAPVAAAPSSVTLPAGTVLLVRMVDSVSSRNAPGANFSTKLEYDLAVNGVVAVKAGTIVYGKVQSATQAGRMVGRSSLDIRLAQMVPNGSPVPIVTSGYAQQGQSEGRKTLLAAGAGAVIGNNTGGSSGSGAAWGAGAAALKPGQTLTIPRGALLEFTLTQPVTVPVAR